MSAWSGMGWDGRAEGVVPADHMLSYRAGCFFSSHSWHFLTVPPYSQYSGGRVHTAGVFVS